MTHTNFHTTGQRELRLPKLSTPTATDSADKDTLTLKRVALRRGYTIGRLYWGGAYLCDTLEPPCIAWGREAKPKGGCAIPPGRYELRMDVVSPRFSNFRRYPWAQPWGGRLPRLVGVPQFEGVLLHVGNLPRDTSGCILVGRNALVGQLSESRRCFRALMERLAARAQHRLWLRIDMPREKPTPQGE